MASMIAAGIMKQWTNSAGHVYCSYTDYSAEDIDEIETKVELGGEDSFFILCLRLMDAKCLCIIYNIQCAI